MIKINSIVRNFRGEVFQVKAIHAYNTGTVAVCRLYRSNKLFNIPVSELAVHKWLG